LVSLASATVVFPWDSWGGFGFNVITVNPCLVINNGIFEKKKFVICSLEEIFTDGKSLQFLIISQESWAQNLL
jgi:hypothetical protein